MCADYALITLFIIANGADYKLGLSHPPALVSQIGLGLYVVGEAGNFLHHRILAALRTSDSDTKYMPPSGGLFELVAAPHYLFELVAWWGIGRVAMHWNALLVAGKKTIFILSTFCLQTIILPRQAPDKRREISFKKRSFSRCSHYDFLSRRSVRRSESLEPPGKKTGFLSHLYIKVIFLPRQARDKHRENSKQARFVAEVRGGRMARESQESDPLPVLGQASIALAAAGPACTPLVVLTVTMTPAIIRPQPSA